AHVSAFLGFLQPNQTSGNYVTIQQILTVGAVGSSRGQIDVSAHGDLWSDTIPGRLDGNEIDVVLLWDPADSQHQAIKADYDASTQTSRNYQLQHPAWATAYQFPALIFALEFEATDDGGMEGHFTLKIITPGVTTVTPS